MQNRKIEVKPTARNHHLFKHAPPQEEITGLYGGTFDPIHGAHIMIVMAAKTALHLKEVRLIPCYKPAHGKQPIASASDRLRMVELAIKNKKGLVTETCEYMRETPSKTIDTLRELRARNTDTTFCLIIGMDGLVSFTSWHEWQEILKLAHLVVAERPGYKLPNTGIVANLIKEREAKNLAALHSHKAGLIMFFPAPQLEVSSTAIRSNLIKGETSSLIPYEVQEYITQRNLYTNKVTHDVVVYPQRTLMTKCNHGTKIVDGSNIATAGKDLASVLSNFYWGVSLVNLFYQSPDDRTSNMSIYVGAMFALLAFGAMYAHRKLNTYHQHLEYSHEHSHLTCPQKIALAADFVIHTGNTSGAITAGIDFITKGAIKSTLPQWGRALVQCGATLFGAVSAVENMKRCKNALLKHNRHSPECDRDAKVMRMV